jgi:nucleotide-binding universal stress UspA family protein
MIVPAVVVGYDGSPNARMAVEWAGRAAAATGRPLKIVHAVGLLEHAGLSETDAHREVALAAATEAGMAPVDVEWCVLDGDACSVLLRMADPPEAVAMIVVGSRGAGAHRGMLLGSTSLQLAEHAPVPVTIVPASAS